MFIDAVRRCRERRISEWKEGSGDVKAEGTGRYRKYVADTKRYYTSERGTEDEKKLDKEKGGQIAGSERTRE